MFGRKLMVMVMVMVMMLMLMLMVCSYRDSEREPGAEPAGPARLAGRPPPHQDPSSLQAPSSERQPRHALARIA